MTRLRNVARRFTLGRLLTVIECAALVAVAYGVTVILAAVAGTLVTVTILAGLFVLVAEAR